MNALLVAAVEHSPPVDHGGPLVAFAVIAAAGGLVYGLRRVVARRRADAARSDEGRSDSGPPA